MKIRSLSLYLATILLLAGAARLGAQTQPQNRSIDQALAQREIDARRLFMNQAEKIYMEDAARDQAIQASLMASTYDVNRDGKLDEKEFATWQKRVRTFVQQQPRLMKKFDLDHDGILSNAEWDSAYSGVFETGPAPVDAKK